MRDNILVFAYYSYKDPVFQSAVLPYFQNLSIGNRQIVLFTWEQGKFACTSEEANLIKSELVRCNIIWCSLKYHTGSFKLLKKAYDFGIGLANAIRLIKIHNIGTIYTEGFPGAIIAHYLAKLTRCNHVIHTFEPHADYMLDAKVWTEKSWEYKILKSLELPIANRSKAIITATEAYRHVLLSRGVKTNIVVSPSCINLNEYIFDPIARRDIRGQQNISDETIVITYLGKLGGMYMDREIFSFWKECILQKPDRFYFMLLSDAPSDEIESLLHEYSIPRHRFFSKYLVKTEVPKYLSAADYGFCGIRPIPSRMFSSPIKNGEYWACRLPVICPAGISDDYRLIKECNAGYIFESEDDYPNIIGYILNSTKEGHEIKRDNALALAQEYRSLEKYKQKIYELL